MVRIPYLMRNPKPSHISYLRSVTESLVIILLSCLICIGLAPEARSMGKKDTEMTDDKTHQTLQEDKLRELFIRYLCNQLRKKSSDILVSRFKVTGNRPVPAGTLGIQFFQKHKRRLKGYVRLTALISVDGTVKNRVKLSGWVDVFGSVVCASRNLKKGDVLQKDDLYLARKNISYLSTHVLTDINKVLGLMLKHDVKADSCIKKWMLQRSPVVGRGDLVTILAESGNLRITVPGRILEKGYLGDLIRVRNTMSKRDIYARVLNGSIVKVEF